MNKIIVAIDSFKGSLTSSEANQAAKEGIKAICPDCEVLTFPIADGGEGTLEILTKAMSGRYIPLCAHNALMEPIQTQYAISQDGKTALIEMAGISGLTLIPPEKRNPMLTTTYGTGELILDAYNKGCRDFIIGIGGSATNDAGLGLLQALGYRFFNQSGDKLGVGGKIMQEVVTIDTSKVPFDPKDVHFTIACDVRNPFYGPEGAAHVYARQKGADEEMIRLLDAGMRSLAGVIQQTTGKDISFLPGAGAAGGTGGSLVAFLNAELKSGIELLLNLFDFNHRIIHADLIITGEGKADRQTTMGKVPLGVLTIARQQQIPVIMIAGSIEDVHLLNQAGFTGVFSITPAPVNLQLAMQPDYTKKNMKELVSQIILTLKAFIP